MPIDLTTPITRNDDLGNGNYLVEFPAPGIAETMEPAQFFMVAVPGSETLLRRPYSVCGLPGTFDDRPADAVQLLYKVVGKGTALLASMGAGAALRVLGPLGRGFALPERADARAVLVAGGIGAAPFPALAARLRERGQRPIMFYGARHAADLPLLDWFRGATEELIATTEDGSLGRRGLVTDPLAELFGSADPHALHVYACGPEPMLRAVARLALARGIRCDLALEAHMACGFGVCLGCVVPVHRPDGAVAYERVCVEGPVMAAERLAW